MVVDEPAPRPSKVVVTRNFETQTDVRDGTVKLKEHADYYIPQINLAPYQFPGQVTTLFELKDLLQDSISKGEAGIMFDFKIRHIICEQGQKVAIFGCDKHNCPFTLKYMKTQEGAYVISEVFVLHNHLLYVIPPPLQPLPASINPEPALAERTQN